MTDQHRATPEDWALIQAWDTITGACILELRTRVEALEEARSATIDRMTEMAILGGEADAA